ncbi:hypothetical protein [Natronolimnobius baerhuensis]|uniref:hypothetical protein n=1 Tax=Natronolimnobius baerhuensis TaxID=253108 RepID=UPI001124CFD0|nr:hypothetical protein [Natronolimnobius baerhuensis]
MNRRNILATSGLIAFTSTAGCLGLGNQMTDDFERKLSIHELEQDDNDSPYTLDVVTLENEINSQHSATFEISITNDSQSVVGARIPFYKMPSSNHGSAGIIIYSLAAADSLSVDSAPECASNEDINWTLEGVQTPDLEPGETISNEYIIADDPSADGCFPTGEYQMESLMRYGQQDEDVTSLSILMELHTDT